MSRGWGFFTYPQVFGHSKQLSLSKFFDPSTPSMRKEDDGGKKYIMSFIGAERRPTGTPTSHANIKISQIVPLQPPSALIRYLLSVLQSGQPCWQQSHLLYHTDSVSWHDNYFFKFQKQRQAGAELCQAQHSLSLDLDTNQLGLITQPAVTGARSVAELQLRIYWHKGIDW